MITDIRKQIQSPVFRVMLGIMLVSLMGLSTVLVFFRQGTGSGHWIARIDGATISYEQFRSELIEKRDQLAALRAQYGEYTDMLLAMKGLSSNPQALAADSLIREALINKAAKQVGLHLHSDFISDHIRGQNQEVRALIPEYALDEFGNIDQGLLKEYLARRGMSISDFEEKLEHIMMRKMVGELVVASVHVPEFDVQSQLIADHAHKKFAVLHFSLDSFLVNEKKKELTDEQLKGYYDRQNQQFKRYWVPEKRNAIVWKFEPHDYGIEITDKQIARYYDDHKTRSFVKEPTKIQVRRILFAVAEGQDKQVAVEKAQKVHAELIKDPSLFAQRAIELSDDKQTAKNGGLMPFFARGEHEQEFEKPSFLLKNDGDVSRLLQTSQGYEIVQRVGRKNQTYKLLKDVAKDIKQSLYREQFAKLFAKDVKQLSRKAKGDAAVLAKFVREKGGDKQVVKGTLKAETVRAKTIFGLKQGELGSYIDNGIGYVVQLSAIEKRHMAPYVDVKETVKSDMYEERAMQALKAEVARAFELAKNSSLSDIKNQFDARFEQTKLIQPDEGDDVKDLQDKGLPAYRMIALEKQGGAIVSDTPNGGVIVQLVELKPIDKENLAEKKKDVRAKLEAHRYQLTMEGFVASSYRNATIKMNESLLGIS